MKKNSFVVVARLLGLAVLLLAHVKVNGADPAKQTPADDSKRTEGQQGRYSVIGGGRGNSAPGNDSTVGGGSENVSLGKGAVVSGGEDNRADALHSTIAGGRGNRTTQPGAVVSGGAENLAFGHDSAIGGGYRNVAFEYAATIGGGRAHQVRAMYGTIGGGDSNVVSGAAGTVGGGVGNQTTGVNGFIGGGFGNRVSGVDAAVLAGVRNEANGQASVAMGTSAKADHTGSFVFADRSGGEFESIVDNEFAVRVEQLRIQRGSLRVNSQVRSFLEGGVESVNESRRLVTFSTPGFANGGNWSWDVDQSGSLVVVRDGVVMRAALDPEKGGWVHASDREFKRDLSHAGGMLDKVDKLQPRHYRLKSGGVDAPRQIGLVAQEVMPVLPELVSRVNGRLALGYDRVGVIAVGAVKELHEKTNREISELERENRDLRGKLTALMKRVEQLESMVRSGE